MSIVKFSEVAHRAYTREDRFNTEKIYYVGGEHIDSCELYVTKKGVIKVQQLDQCSIAALLQGKFYLLHEILI